MNIRNTLPSAMTIHTVRLASFIADCRRILIGELFLLCHAVIFHVINRARKLPYGLYMKAIILMHILFASLQHSGGVQLGVLQNRLTADC